MEPPFSEDDIRQAISDTPQNSHPTLADFFNRQLPIFTRDDARCTDVLRTMADRLTDIAVSCDEAGLPQFVAELYKEIGILDNCWADIAAHQRGTAAVAASFEAANPFKPTASTDLDALLADVERGSPEKAILSAYTAARSSARTTPVFPDGDAQNKLFSIFRTRLYDETNNARYGPHAELVDSETDVQMAAFNPTTILCPITGARPRRYGRAVPCGHFFDHDAILQLLRAAQGGPNAKSSCPHIGCTAKLGVADIVLDARIQKRVERRLNMLDAHGDKYDTL